MGLQVSTVVSTQDGVNENLVSLFSGLLSAAADCTSSPTPHVSEDTIVSFLFGRGSSCSYFLQSSDISSSLSLLPPLHSAGGLCAYQGEEMILVKSSFFNTIGPGFCGCFVSCTQFWNWSGHLRAIKKKAPFVWNFILFKITKDFFIL
jgi:hypothetical protein